MKKLNKQNKILKKKYYIKNSLLKKELIKNKKEKIWIRGNPLISILNTLILEWYSSISIQIAI